MNALRFTEQNLRQLGLLCALGTLLAVSAIPSNAVASPDEIKTESARTPDEITTDKSLKPDEIKTESARTPDEITTDKSLKPDEITTDKSLKPDEIKTDKSRKPTIVLVHGAFADASSWAEVTLRLQKQGYTVLAFANPLRSISGDAEYLRLFLGTLTGPIVLVGHSYGGAVITNAATGNPNVKALVYIAAYALDEGETLSEANALGGGHSELSEHLVLRPFPGSGTTNADAYVDPAFFRELFAADLRAKDAAVVAASQRPAALSVFGEPSGPPAWQGIPSWYLVARHDNAIPPEAERFMANRAGAETVEISSSHVAMISHPGVVTALIVEAASHHGHLQGEPEAGDRLVPQEGEGPGPQEVSPPLPLEASPPPQ